MVHPERVCALSLLLSLVDAFRGFFLQLKEVERGPPQCALGLEKSFDLFEAILAPELKVDCHVITARSDGPEESKGVVQDGLLIVALLLGGLNISLLIANVALMGTDLRLKVLDCLLCIGLVSF